MSSAAGDAGTVSDPVVWVNGAPGTSVSVLDRGLQFGDGLFETIACVGGRPRFLPLHLERLEFGCERLQIAVPSLDRLRSEIEELAGQVERSIIKLLVTGGTALARGYGRTGRETATRITIRYSWPQQADSQRQDGVMARTLSMRLGENPRLAGLKHCNRLEQVLARAELAAHPDVGEGLLMSSSGNLVSGTMSNVFLVRDSALLTPRTDLCGVSGVMRRVVLREARRVGIPARECELRSPDVASADEVFFTNARVGILPAKEVDGRLLTPGPITRHLQTVMAPLLGDRVDA